MSQVHISEVLGNSQRLDGGAMFGNAPHAMWSRWIQPDELNRIPLACRALLIEYDGKKILCETGIGAFFEPKMADRFGIQTPEKHVLLESLNTLGLADSEIDYVILSHLHFDHAGGLLSPFEEGKEKKLLFPNAKYITGREAFERSKNPHKRDRASFIPELAGLLENSGRLLLVDGEKCPGVFEDRLSFFISNGHTPGQMHTVFKGDEHKIIFAGDLVPGEAWVHLPITMGYDRFAEMVIDEKTELYNSVVPEKTWLFYTHDATHACSKVIKNEKGKYQASESVLNPVRMSI